MAEISEDAAVELLGNVFGSAPKPVAAPAAPVPQAAAPATEPIEPAIDLEGMDVDEDAQPGDVVDPNKVEPAVNEPEFEIDFNGAKEVVHGGAKVKELLQKGRLYEHTTAEHARAREAIAAQYQQQEQQAKFQQAVLPEIMELQALDKQLAAYANYDWATAIDQDFIGANKLQMQWNQLKDLRSNKFTELSGKQQQWEQAQAQASQAVLVAEHKALLAKLPAWANNETASVEKQAIGRALREDYGYQDNELSLLTDHRAMLVARDAMKWRELQRNKAGKLKQVREAPPVNKPGAAASQQAPNARAADGKFIQQFRADGRKGNHRAQEASLVKILGGTFKS